MNIIYNLHGYNLYGYNFQVASMIASKVQVASKGYI